MNRSGQMAVSDTEGASYSAKKEEMLRMWIAQKESICPYAPGVAQYIHLPQELGSNRAWAAYYASVLKQFNKTKVKGKKLERLILIPPVEWTNHNEARTYAIANYWRLNAGYFLQTLNGRRQAASALAHLEHSAINQADAHAHADITNPVVGVQAPLGKAPHPKALFCTTFSGLYHSNKYYRYAPCSAMVLVNVASLLEKRNKQAKVTKQIASDQLYGIVVEAMRGDESLLRYEALAVESKEWESLLFRLYVLRNPLWRRLPQPQISDVIGDFNHNEVDALFVRNLDRLPVLKALLCRTDHTPYKLLSACYPHTGLYAMPSYFV